MTGSLCFVFLEKSEAVTLSVCLALGEFTVEMTTV